ncbi:MAG: hypothetical protein EXR92_03845 [Gemmatimonadetes bacterium]|nr:hypothetical protein [Gemmatimonadota bacterium]
MRSLKNIIKRTPSLFRIARAIKQTSSTALKNALYSKYNGVISELRIFAPTPSGSVRARFDLTLLSAKQVIPLLGELVKASRPQPSGRVVTVAEFCDELARKG